MWRHAALLFVLLGLVLLAAPTALAGDEPDPEDVAAWILGGDDHDAQRAVRALEGAPASFIARVVRALREAAPGDGQPGPALPPKATPLAPMPDDLPWTVHVGVQVWSVPEGAAASLLEGSGGSLSVHYLETMEATALLELLKDIRDAELLQGPRLVVEDREPASIEVTEAYRYAKDARVTEVDGEPFLTLDYDDVDEGLVIKVRPVISADRKYVTLELELVQTAVERPVPVEEIEIEGFDEPVEIHAPVVRETPSRATLALPDEGRVALAGIPASGEERKELVILVSAAIQPSFLTEPEALIFEELGEAGRVINLEVRFLEVDPEVMTRVVGVPRLYADEPHRLLEAKHVLGLLGKDREGAEGVRVLSAPRLTTYDGQQANISMLNQTSYVQDFEVRRVPAGTTVDPIIGTIQDGIVLDVTPRIREHGRGLLIECKTSWADLIRPIPEFETELEGQKVTIQLPEVRVARTRDEVLLPPGGYALLGTVTRQLAEVWPGGRESAERCLMLHASVIQVKDLLRKAPPK